MKINILPNLEIFLICLLSMLSFSTTLSVSGNYYIANAAGINQWTCPFLSFGRVNLYFRGFWVRLFKNNDIVS